MRKIIRKLKFLNKKLLIPQKNILTFSTFLPIAQAIGGGINKIKKLNTLPASSHFSLYGQVLVKIADSLSLAAYRGIVSFLSWSFCSRNPPVKCGD